MSLKNPVTPPGIDPGTVRLVAQRFNHYATPGRTLGHFVFTYVRCAYVGFINDNVVTIRSGSSVGIATELRAGRFGDRIPVGGEIFRTSPDRP